MSKRYTITDLRRAILNYNSYLALSGSNVFFVENPHNGMQGVDMHYVEEDGSTSCHRNVGLGTSRECYQDVLTEYRAYAGKVLHPLKPTRRMAKAVISKCVSFNHNPTIALTCQFNADLLTKWAELTGYRVGTKASRPQHFYNHLKNKVSI